jgi:Asp-tRNA(Asn)/Glu-tRNA(Gln) amidotransferase B subunit
LFTVDEAIRRETVDLIQKSLPPDTVESTIEKLQRGEISDDYARKLIRLYAEQNQDDSAIIIRPQR